MSRNPNIKRGKVFKSRVPSSEGGRRPKSSTSSRSLILRKKKRKGLGNPNHLRLNRAKRK